MSDYHCLNCGEKLKECSTGIHFFITKQEAIDYV